MQEETLEPQPASEKKSNAPVALTVPAALTPFTVAADLAVGPDYTGTAVMPLPRPLTAGDPSVINVGFASPAVEPCRVVIRQPTGVRPRGMKCLTCGTQADEGQELVCSPK